MPGPGGHHGGPGGPGGHHGGPGGPHGGFGHGPRPPMGGGWGHRPPPPRRAGGCCGCMFPVLGIMTALIAGVLIWLL